MVRLFSGAPPRPTILLRAYYQGVTGTLDETKKTGGTKPPVSLQRLAARRCYKLWNTQTTTTPAARAR